MIKPLLPGMTDLEAANRLEGMLILGVENKGLDDAAEEAFQAFRTAIRSREDLSDVIPAPVQKNRNLSAFWSYCKAYNPSWEPRRQHIRAEFAPLFERLEDQATNPPREGLDSSKWTGRRTATVQARVIRTLVPEALAGLEELIERLELPFHNGGPRSPEIDTALEALRHLHHELGELLGAVESEQPLLDRLEAIRARGRAAFVWSPESFGLTIKGLPLAGTTTVLACGVSKLLTVIAGIPLAQAAAIGVAAAAANAAHVVKVAPERAKRS